MIMNRRVLIEAGSISWSIIYGKKDPKIKTIHSATGTLKMRAIFILRAVRSIYFFWEILKDKEPVTMQALYETLLNSFSRALPGSVNRVCKQLSWWLTLRRDDKISEAVNSLKVCRADFKYTLWNTGETVARVTDLFRLRDEFVMIRAIEFLSLFVAILFVLAVLLSCCLCSCCCCRRRRKNARAEEVEEEEEEAVAPPIYEEQQQLE